MGKSYIERKISQEFINYLNKNMSNVLNTIKNDDELALCIRNNKLDIYYKKVVILSVSDKKNHYEYEISPGIFTLGDSTININNQYCQKYINQIIEVRNKIKPFFNIKYIFDFSKVSYMTSIIDKYNIIDNKIVFFDEDLNGDKIEQFIIECNKLTNEKRVLLPPGSKKSIEYINKNKTTIKLKDSVDINSVFNQRFIHDIKKLIDYYELSGSKSFKEFILQIYLFNNYKNIFDKIKLFNDSIMIDLEYNIPALNNPDKLGRQDNIAINIDNNEISIIEVKYNSKSITGKAGINEHINDILELVDVKNKKKIDHMTKDVVNVTKALRDLKQIDIRGNIENYKIEKINYIIIVGCDKKVFETKKEVKKIIDNSNIKNNTNCNFSLIFMEFERNSCMFKNVKVEKII